MSRLLLSQLVEPVQAPPLGREWERAQALRPARAQEPEQVAAASGQRRGPALEREPAWAPQRARAPEPLREAALVPAPERQREQER